MSNLVYLWVAIVWLTACAATALGLAVWVHRRMHAVRTLALESNARSEQAIRIAGHVHSTYQQLGKMLGDLDTRITEALARYTQGVQLLDEARGTFDETAGHIDAQLSAAVAEHRASRNDLEKAIATVQQTHQTLSEALKVLQTSTVPLFGARVGRG